LRTYQVHVPGFGVPYVPNMIPQIPPQHTTDTPGAGCAGDTNVPQRENAHIHTAATVHTGRVTTLEVRLWVDAMYRLVDAASPMRVIALELRARVLVLTRRRAALVVQAGWLRAGAMASRSGALDLVQPDEWMINKRPHNQSEIFPSILTLPTGGSSFCFHHRSIRGGGVQIRRRPSVDHL
jgi:hypothetical protein